MLIKKEVNSYYTLSRDGKHRSSYAAAKILRWRESLRAERHARGCLPVPLLRILSFLIIGSTESRVSHGAGVKNAGSFRRCTTQGVQTAREGREIVGTRRGRNSAARENEKSDDERALLFVSSSHIFDCRSRNRFIARAYIAVLTFPSFFPCRIN